GRLLEEVGDGNSGSPVILMPQHRLNSELQVAHAGYSHPVVRSLRNVAVDIKFKKNAAAGGKAQRERIVLHGTQSGSSQVTAVAVLHLKHAGPVKLGGIGNRRTSWNNELRVSGGLGGISLSEGSVAETGRKGKKQDPHRAPRPPSSRNQSPH